MTDPGPAAAAVAALLVLAVLSWPRRRPAAVVAPVAGLSPFTRLRDRLRLGRRWPGRADEHEEAAVLGLVEAVGAALEAGLTPAAALAVAAQGRSRDADCGPVDAALPGLLFRARTGEGIAGGWRDLAEQTGSRELRLLARAWALSEHTGAPLAGAARTAARLIRQDRDQRRRAAAAVAGAHATMTILTLLPLGGPVLAAVMGLDLADIYASSPLVWACLAAGVGLVLIGRWWVARLVVLALRGPVLR